MDEGKVRAILNEYASAVGAIWDHDGPSMERAVAALVELAEDEAMFPEAYPDPEK